MNQEEQNFRDSAYKKANKVPHPTLEEIDMIVKDMDMEELKVLLITTDGKGKDFKTITLNELIGRIKCTV